VLFVCVCVWLGGGVRKAAGKWEIEGRVERIAESAWQRNRCDWGTGAVPCFAEHWNAGGRHRRQTSHLHICYVSDSFRQHWWYLLSHRQYSAVSEITSLLPVLCCDRDTLFPVSFVLLAIQLWANTALVPLCTFHTLNALPVWPKHSILYC